MNRARAVSLTLVNWKGVFYERYLLDRHVTALEGANGAGKTTVMIAAYVALMPDMSRLRFTNIGESGATGGDRGIWGRLGEPSRPSYTVIDFMLPRKERLLAGVHLERKGEPSVEAKPFIITGLAEDVSLQELLLISQGEHDMVPEFPELREQAARMGGHVQGFATPKEYFSALFEQGITPMRLASDEERKKYNEMLRTSMTGGISRGLSTELRTFLLTETNTLSNTLANMRSSLDACRRTRLEVQDAQRLEREIGGIFEAGHSMFAAAYLATSERAAWMERLLTEAEEAHAQAVQAQDEAHGALQQIRAALVTLDEERQELEARSVSAKEHHAALKAALLALEELARYAGVLQQAEQAARQAREQRARAEDESQLSYAALQRTEDNYNRAAAGLADLQQGIEELHRRAAAHRKATQSLQHAEACLDISPLPTERIQDIVQGTREDVARLDQQRRDAATQVADAAAHRALYAQAMAALQAMVAEPCPPAMAARRSAEALHHYRDQVALAARLPRIQQDLATASSLAARQARARDKADRLGVQHGDAPAGQVIGALIDTLEAQCAHHEQMAQQAREATLATEQRLKELERQRHELETRVPRWRQLEAMARALADATGIVLLDRSSLDAARRLIAQRLATSQRAAEDAKDRHEQLAHEARALLAAAGPYPGELLRLRDQLDAELLAASFEDVALEEAACLEATLGHLTQALVVDDPKKAALLCTQRAESLEQVWFVSRDTDLHTMATTRQAAMVAERDLLVDEGSALRLARLSATPRLGRRAREARAAELQQLAEIQARQLEEDLGKCHALERLAAQGDALLAGCETWLLGDPSAALAAVCESITQAQAQCKSHQEARAGHVEALRAPRQRLEALRTLLGESMLLDPPDHSAQRQLLEAERDAAEAARAAVDAHQDHAAFLEQNSGVLHQMPLSDDEVMRLSEQVAELKVRRERLDAGLEALEYLRDNLEALGWQEAAARLASEQALVPALKAQLQETQGQRDKAMASHEQAQRRLDAAMTAFHHAEGSFIQASKEHESARQVFEGWGIPQPTPAALEEVARAVARLEQQQHALARQQQELIHNQGRQEKILEDAQGALRDATGKLAAQRREAEPAARRWEELQALAQHHGLLGGMPDAWPADLVAMRSHMILAQEANARHRLLAERLRHAHGGAELLARLEAQRKSSDATLAYLEQWLGVRNWLRGRLPAQVAELDDPLQGLLRLREQLITLEERLLRQEGDLRGSSANVATEIEGQIRRARGQVNRLNDHLREVGFGSICGIRVNLQYVALMQQVLLALREGDAQALLFQSDLSIEEALEEIFRRHGGGRTGGQHLLDYRAYIHLQMQIRRRSGGEWEDANPTRLSTGEAIGVGAALMMVVLSEWERAATMLRGKRQAGSLRFLFLDEANRLSQDNLGVLFDLCQTLDLQLLIAAPEVAQAAGNTTYHLVRHTTDDGREEVLVSGRRARVSA
jgi:chromosome partition protein MukB